MKSLFYALIASLVLCPAFAKADADRPRGLMWNKSGLPLVFPLIVKSNPCRDYYLNLSFADTGDPALAAYIRGGEFFRVLVPPGRFDVSFAAGRHWEGETTLFGEGDTVVFALNEPLEFSILNDQTKGGHIVDLRAVSHDGVSGITVAATFICQGLSGAPERTVAAAPQASQNDPVGQDILERRFLRGADVFETYDRQRQQRDLDPPVLGVPRVPLADIQVPTSPQVRVPASTNNALRVYERPC